MKNTVTVRNVVFGEGLPKICIPLSDTNLEELKTSAQAMKQAPFDFVEWRADFFENVANAQARFQAIEFLRTQLGDAPLLFTIRTSVEGGKIEISTSDYLALNLDVINSGTVDLVDVELSRGADTMKQLVEAARQKGVKIVASCHDNHKTPTKDAIVNTLCEMQQLGADIAKFAVMPQTHRDVLTLLDATLTMEESHNDTPVITMSMGRLGVLSRVCGTTFGSAVTFGTAGKASAPGQLPADLLSDILQALA